MGRVVCACGARETEDLLLKDIDADQAQVRQDPELLAHPFLIVVPSSSLRDHLSARIADHCKSALGVVIQTHLQTAYEITRETISPASVDHDPTLALFIRRAAGTHPVLRGLLEELVQGYDAVIGSVDDLLHAEFSSQILEPAREAIDTLSDSPVAAERARAVVEVAAAALDQLRERGLYTRDLLIEEATDGFRRMLLLGAGETVFARAIRIHGFADATGIVGSFLEALLSHDDSALFLERPRNPSRPGELDPGIAFSRPFGLRLGESNALPTPTSPSIETSFFTAPGARAEAREVARRVRQLLDEKDPPPPERIGVVARNLSRHLFDLQEAFDDHGIPWQAPGSRGAIDPPGRLLLGLQQLLTKTTRCPLDHWMQAMDPTRQHMLWRPRVAAAALGSARLSQWVSLPLDRVFERRRHLNLPLQQGFIEARDEEEQRYPRLQRETVTRQELESFQHSARTLMEELKSWAQWGKSPVDPRQHILTLRRLVDGFLSWPSSPSGRAARERLDSILQGFAPQVEVDFHEFVSRLNETIPKEAAQPAGDGGGVRFLGVTEARSWTFDHLFLVGLNRGVFPPSFREDPLLSDRVRAKLRSVLPQLKSKRERIHEERFLFAQLLGSAPRITLSWWSADEEGRALSPSPFLQRLLMGSSREPCTAPGPLDLAADDGPRPRPMIEHLLDAALRQDSDRFQALLPLALEEAAPAALASRWPSSWAAPARRVLEEWDRSPQRSSDLGPWLGGIGSQEEDAQQAPVWVSHLESYARCPWAAFLERTLGLKPLPDPLSELPTLDRRRVGSVVHKTLEGLVRKVTGVPPRLDQLVPQAEAREVGWPPEEDLSALIELSARKVLLEEGLVLDGLAHALAVRARPYLETCRTLLFLDQPVWALGAEVTGAVELTLDRARRRRVHFRVDLVHRQEGELRLVDFKTGRSRIKAATTSRQKEGLRQKLRAAVASGGRLQGMIYALGASKLPPAGQPAAGVYLHLDADAPAELRAIEYRADDREMEDTLREVIALLDRGRGTGLFFPRLTTPDGRKEPSACDYCRVAAACARRDSQSRQREVEYFARLGRRRDEGESLDPAEEALLQLWNLPDAKGGPE